MARRIWAPGLIWCAGAKLDIRGLENVDFSRPHVFVANHVSTIDIPVVFAAIPVNLRFIIKKELTVAPFVGLFAWATGMVFVDRKESKGALAVVKRVGSLSAAGQSVIAFPEGTRNRSNTLLPFKKGAFRLALAAQVPIVPFVAEPMLNFLDARRWMIRPGRIRVRFLPPVPTAGRAPKEVEALLKEVQSLMQSALDDLRATGRGPIG